MKSEQPAEGENSKSALLRLEAYVAFLLEILQTIADHETEPQKVYPRLKANLDKLDDTFVEVLRRWAAITLPQVEPVQALIIAAALVNFGNSLRSFPHGNKAINLEIAIAACEATAPILTRAAFPEHWATAQNMLGILYRNRIRGDRAQNLEQSIRYFENALQIRNRADSPELCAETQNSLGNAYNEHISGSRLDNVENAIAAFEAALEVRTRAALPENWATTQNNLGIAYYNRLKGDRADNLEQAIACYQNALQIRTREQFPTQWAETQNNLANAYSERIRGDRAENLEQALKAFQSVLQVYTWEAFPSDWAMTQNNLGETYRDRLMGDRSENLDAAIAAYQAALHVYTCEVFPEQWAIVQNNLGIAYYSQLLEDRSEALEQAIACYENALKVRTPTDFPEQWADTQNNLGNAYSDRVRGNRADNLDRAIAAYQAALQVHTCELFPMEWAKTHNNLALVYRDGGQLTEAIACFQVALQVYTPLAFPFECLITGRNLGRTAYSIADWEQSIAGFDIAIQAVEKSRAQASTSGRRQEILSAAIDVYSGVVQACLQCDATIKALEYVERSKSRNLVELFATRNLLPRGHVPPDVLDRLENLRREIGIEQRRLDQNDQRRSRTTIISRSELIEPAEGWFSDRMHLNQLQQQLQSLIQQEIRPYDSTFGLTQQVESISFTQIQQLLPNEQTALIEWYFTDEALLAFLILPQRETPLVWRSSPEDLQALEQWGDGYLTAYTNRKQQWQEDLSDRLHQLAEILHLDTLLSLLPEDCLQLILIPHRFLHVLPLHALPFRDRSCLLERFPQGVRYAPSCQLLHLTQNQKKSFFFESLWAVQNPTGDLSYADLEVSAIRSTFPTAQVLAGREATKTALITHPDDIQADCVHFACHGIFDLESPLESALILAQEQGEPSSQGERLLLSEIFDLDLRRCGLVTLSACETGLTDFTVLSDEYVGLPSGFLYAGTPCLVSSLWTVSDVSTAILMGRFYENLQSQMPVAVALNQAQCWLRDATGDKLNQWIEERPLPLSATLRLSLKRRFRQEQHPFRFPYYWAAFCAIGQS